ncbi:hypothetical protein pEaSNUABM54_00220 [Erwinia phage pEa_SNUABM_54]|nr:hypothetical protein pEaSNUABM54_00220 [Erwinia phage pEa_SNUABM_54]
METRQFWMENTCWELTESDARRLRFLILTGTFLVERGLPIGSVFTPTHPVKITSKEFECPVEYRQIPICFKQNNERIVVTLRMEPRTVVLSGTVGAVIICNKLADLYAGPELNINPTPYHKNKRADWIDVVHDGEKVDELWLDINTVLVKYQDQIFDDKYPDERLTYKRHVPKNYPNWVKHSLSFITC